MYAFDPILGLALAPFTLLGGRFALTLPGALAFTTALARGRLAMACALNGRFRGRFEPEAALSPERPGPAPARTPPPPAAFPPTRTPPPPTAPAPPTAPVIRFWSFCRILISATSPSVCRIG
eukprot:5688048-Pleurochrysis_carterae.AAC.1